MQSSESAKRIDNILLLFVQYGTLLHLLLMFVDKGNALRNIGIYGAFASWMALVARGGIRLKLDPITLAFAVFSASVLISTALSIDPAYSFVTLKRDFLKGLMLFAMISTVFCSIEAIERVGRVLAVSGLALLVFGLHGMLTGPAGVYTPQNPIADLDKNSFGFAMSIIFPFYIYFLSSAKGATKNIFWAVAAIWAFAGVTLSASRASILSLLAVITLWALHYSGAVGKKAVKKIFIGTLFITLLGSITFNIWPESVKQHFLSTGEQLATINMRTYYFWHPAFQAAMNRPLTGWGFGEKIWRNPIPFEGTEKPNTDLTGGLHSTFIGVFFEQGVLGLLAYLSIIGTVLHSLYGFRKTATGKSRLMGVCLIGMAVGVLMIEAFFKVNSIRSMGLMAGLSVALTNIITANDQPEKANNQP